MATLHGIVKLITVNTHNKVEHVIKLDKPDLSLDS